MLTPGRELMSRSPVGRYVGELLHGWTAGRLAAPLSDILHTQRMLRQWPGNVLEPVDVLRLQHQHCVATDLCTSSFAKALQPCDWDRYSVQEHLPEDMDYVQVRV